MSANKIKFWVENFKDLFRKISFLPSSSQTTAERMNSITRLIFVVSIIMILFFGFQVGISFLLLSLVVIISVYYGQSMIQENYQEIPTNKPAVNLEKKFERVVVPVTKIPPESQIINVPPYIQPQNQQQFSYNQSLADGKLIYNKKQCDGVSKNQLLANGGKEGYKVNKNTLIAPVVIPRPYDFGYWRENNLSGLNIINEPRQHDKYRSGYYVQSCKGDKITPAWNVKCAEQEIKEGVKWNYNNPSRMNRNIHNRDNNINGLGCSNNFPSMSQSGMDTVENYSYESSYSRDNISPITQPDLRTYPYTYDVNVINDPFYMQPGDVLTSAGYNPNNIAHNLPSNVPVGNCQKNGAFDQFNKNMYMQTIQPGYYNTSQIMDPISSNIGISFDQQFAPTTVEYQGNDLVYTEHDPRIYQPQRKCKYKSLPDLENVYDPRYSGNGTSYRSYVDRMTGQPRFYYDDIDAIRRPNYVVRSKIDTFDYADTYGPMKPQGMIIDDNTDIREKVQDQFLNDSIYHRTGLQQSLMRKRNNEISQLRNFPISRALQRPMKGC